MYKDWKLALRGFSVCIILVVEALSNPVSQKKKQPIYLSSGQFLTLLLLIFSKSLAGRQ